MRRISLVVVTATLLISTMQVGIPAAHADGRATTSYYLALGDSMAAGFQPNTGLTRGYVGRVWGHFRRQIPGLSLRNLGCPGETTHSLITGKHSPCTYGAGSQLDAAISFLGAHAGAVSFVTITVGVNDLVEHCLNGRTGRMERACAVDIRPGVKSRLTTIVDALATAAPGVPVVGMTYHDPFLGLWGLVPGGFKLARADHRAMTVLNAGLASGYGDAGLKVADVAETFQTDDFTDTVIVPGRGRLPVNVAHACGWTWFCTAKYFFDPHPNWKGYKRVARTFDRKLRGLLA
ncbi:MAG: SGNH/GDSL hydrolase family protein [Actinomycetota bacterium]